MINDAGLCKAVPSKNALLLTSSQEGPNEMKKMWDMARDFRDYIRKNPENADYFLYADYILSGYVHFALCDKQGEWVVADLQNSTQPEFRQINPTSIQGCNKLLVNRLDRYLKWSVAEMLRETIKSSGTEAAKAKFKEFHDKKDYYLSEDEMNNLGYEYLNSKKYNEAIVVLAMNVEAFPESFNTYDSLGEAYAAAGQKEPAIKNYEKSLELNPTSQSGIEALKKLKAE
jgi:tetratricopeptide (TPR) repeat protein